MTDWQPTASNANLRQRAAFIAKIREFFQSRGVLEVETPLLSHATVTDPYVLSIPAVFTQSGSAVEEKVFLQTSPEYAMKRLLASGSGPIYQICKAFRQGDLGKIHNPEFTMLEWYRPSFDHHQLMDEMDEFLQHVLGTPEAKRFTYAEIFTTVVGINPHTADLDALNVCIRKHGIDLHACLTHRNDALDILFTHIIEPQMNSDQPIFLYDYPVSQAALAKIRSEENPPVASRFEVYFKGIELANGFHELQNVDEQRKRFENDLRLRNENHISSVPVDENFLAALAAGLPDCSGVALGVDRLVMLALQAASLREVVSFDFPVA